MEGRIFSLLDEPWILATSIEGESLVLSLTEVFGKAHKIKALSGEMPAQDVAIIRLLLGVLYAVVTRSDEYRQARESVDNELPLKIWKEIWEKKCFSSKEIYTYLHKYQNRFYLIHPERPFYQVAKLGKGTDYKAYKLIGDIAQGERSTVSNGKRLFKYRSDRSIQSIGYAEAARWLIYINAFDDASGKPTVRGGKYPAVGPGWLGKLGVVYATGGSLFETLMLNLSLLDRNKNLWEDGQATWELSIPRTDERSEIPLPNNPISLLTMQSRRISLTLDKSGISGFRALGGDFFQEENSFTELMTTWRLDKSDESKYKPKRHDASKQLWRDFTTLFSEAEDTVLRPGIIEWLTTLGYHGAISSGYVQIRAVSVNYASAQRSAVKDSWEDTISFNASLLSAIGEDWVQCIPKILKTTEQLVNTLGFLAADIAMALGDIDGVVKSQSTKEEAYFRLNMPFRDWLAAIDPSVDSIDEARKSWLATVEGIIRDLGNELISQAGARTFVGREVGQDKKELYTAPKAYKKFQGKIRYMLKEGLSV